MTNQLSDFKEFMKRCNPATLSFLTENQDDFDVAEPCVLQLSFTNMLIHEKPNVIYLTGGASSVRKLRLLERLLGFTVRIRMHAPASPFTPSSHHNNSI